MYSKQKNTLLTTQFYCILTVGSKCWCSSIGRATDL